MPHTPTNAYGQPIGHPLPDWNSRPLPPHTPIEGRYCRLEKLSADEHAAVLYAGHAKALDGRNWTYLPYGPFADVTEYEFFMQNLAQTADPQHYAIIDAQKAQAVGSFALMRIDSQSGTVEIGHVCYTPQLQRSRIGTEAVFLLLKRMFDELGYRRCEWKCDDLNAGSRRAAQRYGFSFEGIFRQAQVYKGRSRDTAWFSIIDGEWPRIRETFELWLRPDNFDADGKQRRPLSEIRTELARQTPI